MATQNSVWVVISCDAVTNRIRSLLDRGFFAEAEQISGSVKSFMNKVSREAEAKGGHLYVTLYERIVMEIPLTFAEELPNIIEGFKDTVGNHVAAGLGMTFDEATYAAQKSYSTGEIELFDPKTTETNEPYYKNDSFYELPPNLFDMTAPKAPDPTPDKPTRDPKAITRPGIEQEIQLETQYVQAIAQTMGAPSPEEMQQQVQAQKAAQGQVEGLPPELQAALQAQQEGDEEGGEKKEKSKDSKKSKGSKDSEDDSESSEDDDESSEDEGDSETNDKLASLLLTAKEHIPDIMKLKEKDPKAFDQAMKLIQKLADLTRQRSKVSKQESESEIERLNKSFMSAFGRGFPVGTRKGRKEKVMINGKATWRSMASGRVLDSKGQQISVKAHNAAAAAGKQNEQ